MFLGCQRHVLVSELWLLLIFIVVIVEVDFADSVAAACGLACFLKMHLLGVVFWC